MIGRWAGLGGCRGDGYSTGLRSSGGTGSWLERTIQYDVEFWKASRAVRISIDTVRREIRIRPAAAVTHSSIFDLIFRVFRSDDDLLFLPVLVVETDGEYVQTLLDDLDGEVALTGFEGDDLVEHVPNR
jgi:hypothetical protein